MVNVLRPFMVRCHRVIGLATALFLFVAGATGAIVSWDHELDEWLNPQLFETAIPDNSEPGQRLFTALELANRYEQQQPAAQVTWLDLHQEPGHNTLLYVEGAADPVSGQQQRLSHNQIAMNPYTGTAQSWRHWGDISLSRENLLPFLYKLHYSLHLPDGLGLELGILFMGVVAVFWTLDCLIALGISFPSRRVWRKSFRFRWRQPGHKLTFDLHRSGGVWIWPLLLIVAFSSISMNLEYQLVRPLLGQISSLTPDAFDTRSARPMNKPASPQLTREQILAIATDEALRLGWKKPPGGLYYGALHKVYGVGFYTLEGAHGDGGLGPNWLQIDSDNGDILARIETGKGTAADIFVQAQYPLHSGRILGLTGRILLSLLGVIVAILSLTGILIWLKRTRLTSPRRAQPDRP